MTGSTRPWAASRPSSSSRPNTPLSTESCNPHRERRETWGGSFNAPMGPVIVSNVTRLREVIVFGSGGHGREVACVAVASGKALKGFVDDLPPAPELLAPFNAGYLGTIAEWEAVDGVNIVVGIGSGAVREKVSRRLAGRGIVGGLVDPHSSVGVDVRLGDGVVIFAQATVTTNIDLGRHTHIGRGAAIGHDCVIGDFVTVMPLASVSGNVTIGERATVGAGAVIRQGQVIGADAYVGAGAVVVSDVPPGVTVVGNPARPIRPNM